MPANTPVFAWPYPLGTDLLADGDDAIRNLATAIENTFKQATWTNLTLINSWVTAGGMTPGYTKIGAVVYLRGSITGGTGGTQPFSLPAGYRPSQSGYWNCSMDGSRVAALSITAAGGTIMYPVGTPFSQISLDQVVFPAGN